jgi:hypothetical protein
MLIIDIKVYDLGNLDTAVRGIRFAGLPRTNHMVDGSRRSEAPGTGSYNGVPAEQEVRRGICRRFWDQLVHRSEGAGADIVARVAAGSTAPDLLDLLGRRGLGLGPPVPRETRHRARLKHGSGFKTARSGIVSHNVAVGTRVLALDLDFRRGSRTDQGQKRARPLVVARGFAEGAVGHFESDSRF